MDKKNPNLSKLVTARVEDPDLIGRRRDQIVTAAIELFGKNGFHKTTIKDIAARAGVSPGLIYQYMNDKDDLLFLAVQKIVHSNNIEIPKAIAGKVDPLAQLLSVYRAYCNVIDENRKAAVLTYRESKSLRPRYLEAIKNMELETNDYIGRCIRDCIKAGYFRPVNVDMVTYNFVVTAHAWALKYWHFRGRVSLRQYVQHNIELFLRGLATTKGWSHYQKLSKRR